MLERLQAVRFIYISRMAELKLQIEKYSKECFEVVTHLH